MSQTRRLSQLFAAESWLNNYRYLVNADFKAYDFETLRATLLNYVKLNNPEDYNDFINSSEYVALIDLLSFLGQNLAFRSDLNLRESFLETAEVRDNILNIARQLGYKPYRNTPARGFLKITSLTTTQNLFDSAGKNLSNQNVVWGDPLNPDFNEQFTVILNEVLNKNNPVGRPTGSSETEYGTTEIYEVDQPDNRQMIFSFYMTAKDNNVYQCEMIPVSFFNKQVVERIPDPYGYMTFMMNNDGTGYASPTNGWFIPFVQGVLKFSDFRLDTRVENRVLDIPFDNINETDVWVQNINARGEILSSWQEVSSINGKNIIFNNVDKNNRKIYEVITRGNDQVSIKFGDGQFSEIPTDALRVWTRQSSNTSYVISSSKFQNISVPVQYIDSDKKSQTLMLTLSLTSDVESNASESITEIKNRASRTAAAQDRMITANDYNSYPEGKVPGISKVKSINRIHTGQSVYADLTDPTGTYRPVITLADDAFVYSSEDTLQDNVKDLIGTQSIYNWICNSLLNRATHQLYYRKYPSIVGSFGSLGALKWRTVDTGLGNFTHGYFCFENGVPVRIGRGNVDPKLRTIRKNTLLKTSSGIWTRLIDIYREGFGVQTNNGLNSGRRSNGEGAVFTSGIVPSEAITEWRPSLRVNFAPGEQKQILEEIKAQRSFGLAYDHVTDTWNILSPNANPVYDPSDFTQLVANSNFSFNAGCNWMIRLEHNSGTNSWTSYLRRDILVLGSEKQLTFHNQKFGEALDQVTRRVLKDSIEILPDNIQVNQSQSTILDVIDFFVLDEGRYDPNRVLLAMPGLADNLVPDDPTAVDRLIAQGTINLIPIEFTDAPGQFTLKPRPLGDTTPAITLKGLKSLLVKSTHVPLRSNRVDAVTTNIIDMFILDTAYDMSFRAWLKVSNNPSKSMPIPMTSYELGQKMSSIIPFKSVSDSVIFHPAKYKLIFGSTADLRNQVTIRVTKNDGTRISSAEIRSRVIAAIDEYFAVENWDFGETFYFTDMAAWIHQRLSGIISSIVLLPKQGGASSASSVFQIKCESDELLLSSATVDDVEVITTSQIPIPVN